jgi:hypothetical protein
MAAPSEPSARLRNPLDTLALSTPLAEGAARLAAADVAGNDASHDLAHLMRVTRMAQRLALEEEFEDVELVEIAALLHDLKVRPPQMRGRSSRTPLPTLHTPLHSA